MMELRPYQQRAVDEIRANYARGNKKVLLHLATGGGKTVVFSFVMKTTAQRGKRAIMAVRGRKLVDQASQRLIREKVEHGVMMAGHWMYRPHLPVQVCSIDTLIARQVFPPADLLVIDEAHMATSDGYRNFISKYPDAFLLPVTATPYPGKSMRHLADTVVRPVSMRELIAQGFLVDGRYFRPFAPDLSGVTVSRATGDYEEGSLARAMDQASLVGDIVDQWKKHGEDRPTIAFAVSVKHSEHIRDSFNAQGIAAEHLDASSSQDFREETIDRLRFGRLKVISNCGILGTGVDIPEVSCGIMARPMKSYCLYVQQIGRLTRPAPGKSDFIVLDHADNVSQHGFVLDEPEAELDGKPPKPKRDVQVCGECFAAFRGVRCPHCGKVEVEKVERAREIVSAPGELKEMTSDDFKKLCEDLKRRERHRDSLVEMARTYGYKPGWIFFKLKEAYGDGAAKSLMKGRWR